MAWVFPLDDFVALPDIPEEGAAALPPELRLSEKMPAQGEGIRAEVGRQPLACFPLRLRVRNDEQEIDIASCPLLPAGHAPEEEAAARLAWDEMPQLCDEPLPALPLLIEERLEGGIGRALPVERDGIRLPKIGRAS